MQLKFDNEQNKYFLKNNKIAIVISDFYEDIANNLLIAATKTLNEYGVKNNNIDTFYVPGAFEIPLMVKKIAQLGTLNTFYDGIITLGAVIKGETPHFDFICTQCAQGIAKASYDCEIPIGFGVLTTNNMTQALNRAGGNKGNKGKEAALAVIKMIYIIRNIQK